MKIKKCSLCKEIKPYFDFYIISANARTGRHSWCIDCCRKKGRKPEFDLSDLPGEIWKPIPRFENKCLVSNMGRIKTLSYEYQVKRQGRIVTTRTKARIRANGINADGYASLTLCNLEYKEFVRVHRVVARVFIPNPENKPTVNHKDGNKQNNRVENLEWATMYENVWHAERAGLRPCRKGDKNGRAILSENDVKTIRELNAAGVNREQILFQYNQVSVGTIDRIIKRDAWKHL